MVRSACFLSNRVPHSGSGGVIKSKGAHLGVFYIGPLAPGSCFFKELLIYFMSMNTYIHNTYT